VKKFDPEIVTSVVLETEIEVISGIEEEVSY
jgi:hypothetical protein